MSEKPQDFNELVTWATWQVIESMTKGQPLRAAMHQVLQGAINIMAEWKQAAKERT